MLPKRGGILLKINILCMGTGLRPGFDFILCKNVRRDEKIEKEYRKEKRKHKMT